MMGRKKKPENQSGIPQYAIDRFARCVFEDIQKDYAKPEVQADFRRWLAQRKISIVPAIPEDSAKNR